MGTELPTNPFTCGYLFTIIGSSPTIIIDFWIGRLVSFFYGVFVYGSFDLSCGGDEGIYFPSIVNLLIIICMVLIGRSYWVCFCSRAW